MSTLTVNRTQKGELTQNGGTLVAAIALAPVIVFLLVLIFSAIMKPLTSNAYQDSVSEQLLIVETQRVADPAQTVGGYSFPVQTGSTFTLPTITPMDTLPTGNEILETLKSK